MCSGAPNYQCVPSGKKGEGTPDVHACIDGCDKPPKWKCNTGANHCEVCSDAERDINPKCIDNVNTCNDQCVVAKTYKCDHSKAQCVTCAPGDDPAFCFGKSECDGSCTASFQCDFPTDVTKSPQCTPCADPTGKSCYKTLSECQQGDDHHWFGCDWQYECQFAASGPTCSKTKNGIVLQPRTKPRDLAFIACRVTSRS